MKKIKMTGLFSLLLFCMVLIPAISASAGFRKQENGRYRYYTSADHYIKSNFKNIRSKGKTYTYYFDADGYMVTGWKQIKTKAGKFWYYFDHNGRMYKNQMKDGRYLQANGRMQKEAVYRQKGFVKDKKGTRYRKPDGTYAQKEWLCIMNGNGKWIWYYFYGTGYMARNTWVGSRHVNQKGRLDKKTA